MQDLSSVAEDQISKERGILPSRIIHMQKYYIGFAEKKLIDKQMKKVGIRELKPKLQRKRIEVRTVCDNNVFQNRTKCEFTGMREHKRKLA